MCVCGGVCVWMCVLNLQLRVKFKDSISSTTGKNPLKLLNAALAVFHIFRFPFASSPPLLSAPRSSSASSTSSFPLH